MLYNVLTSFKWLVCIELCMETIIGLGYNHDDFIVR